MRNGRKKSGKLIAILIMLIVIVLAIGIGVNLYINSAKKPLDPQATETVAIIIEPGLGTNAIGSILYENGIIKSADGFKLIAKLSGNDGKFKAGDYVLSASMSVDEIMGKLIVGNTSSIRFTIPEGLTIRETTKLLADKGMINEETFLQEIENGSFDYKFVEYLPAGANRLEGFLFPETYDVFATSMEHDILNRLLGQFDAVYKDEYYSRATELGYDLNQIITIASLIERETRVDSERAIVASVIYNRLNMGMALQIDATVQYALGEQKDRLSYKDTEIDSPYNTYKVPGLPPGPICSPGEASIKAALYPESTQYVYYVLDAKMDGSHRFSKSYDEFLKNKNAYINAL